MFFSPLEQFEIIPIFSFFTGSKFSFTNSSLFLLLTSFFIIIFFFFCLKNSTVVPNFYQIIVELIFNFVQNIVFESLSKKGEKFFPFIFVTFIFIFFCNILGMIPYTFTVTSHIFLTFSLGFISFVSLNIYGFNKHGLFFFSLFLPPGAPLLLSPLLVPIEIISYIFRVIALSVRLFANLMAGHTLLKILATFAWKMILIGGFFLFIQLFPMIIIIVITGLEIIIAFLQSYVWTILICLYFSDVINLH
jgi:ATP synthase subunit 6